MSGDVLHLLLMALMCWAIIFFIRSIPFLLFGRANSQPPVWLNAVEKWISPAIILGLIVYSYVGLFQKHPPTEHLYGLSEFAAGGLVVILQLLLRNGLLSILGGTVAYMLMLHGGL